MVQINEFDMSAEAKPSRHINANLTLYNIVSYNFGVYCLKIVGFANCIARLHPIKLLWATDPANRLLYMCYAYCSVPCALSVCVFCLAKEG